MKRFARMKSSFLVLLSHLEPLKSEKNKKVTNLFTNFRIPAVLLLVLYSNRNVFLKKWTKARENINSTHLNRKKSLSEECFDGKSRTEIFSKPTISIPEPNVLLGTPALRSFSYFLGYLLGQMVFISQYIHGMSTFLLINQTNTNHNIRTQFRFFFHLCFLLLQLQSIKLSLLLLIPFYSRSFSQQKLY